MSIRENRLTIRMFGELGFSFGPKPIDLKEKLGKHLMLLLEYLIYYRHQNVTKEKLIENLWSDSLNPASALKFSVYRLRQLLNEIDDLSGLECIKTTKTGYSFDPNVEVWVDAEEAEELWKQINDDKITRIEKQELMKRFIEMMTQPFLTSSSAMLWTLPVREYFTHVYNRCVMMYMEDLEIDRRYDEVMQLAQMALRLDPLNEEFHYYFLLGLIETKQYRKAIEYYEGINRRFYKEFNAQLSLRTKSLYNMILSREEVSQIGMGELLETLQENNEAGGAFYCEHEVFKRMYQIALRTEERSDEKSYVMLLEIKTDENEFQLQKTMERLRGIILQSLRKGDIFSRMNPTQFILLLPCKTEENAHVISNRIRSTFQKHNGSAAVKLNYHISPLHK
ncbi:MAG: winged helix-turn-helix domain-containing protein [Erysipelotrichaceae bacterium]